MMLTVRQARDLHAGLSFLAAEPITTHLLNFRLKAALLLLQPHSDAAQKSQLDIVKMYAEVKEDGQPVVNESGQPKFNSAEDSNKAAQAMLEILDSEVEVVGLTKISWDLFEKAKCSYLDKVTGGRKAEALVIPAQLLIALDPIIDGQPQVA
jgi:hypothetical protein